MALSDNTALIGAYYADVGAKLHQGSAYAFVRSGATWAQQGKLIAADGAAGNWFGWSVAVSGNTALVGPYLHDVGGTVGQGAAYVFVRSGTTWTQQAQLTAADGASEEHFARAVALNGDTALLGAADDDAGRGAAYVFARSGAAWVQQAKLVAADRELQDYYGWSVALDGDTAVTGAPYDDVRANDNQGTAEVFMREGTTWTRQAVLIAADGTKADHLAISAALSGDTVLLGAYWEDVGVAQNQGSAYFFYQPPFRLFLPLTLRSAP